MAQPTEKIRRHHASISRKLQHLAERVEELQAANVEAARGDLEGFVDFLLHDLKPHAEGEERALYPAVDTLILQHSGRPTATMSLEHVAIAERIEAFCAAVAQILAASPDEREAALAKLRRAAHYLDALVPLHLHGEEEALLPYLDAHLSAEQVDEIVREMHGH